MTDGGVAGDQPLRPGERFRKLGWSGPISGGNHQFMTKGTRKVRIPNPHKGDVGIGLLARILGQAGLTADEWNEE